MTRLFLSLVLLGSLSACDKQKGAGTPRSQTPALGATDAEADPGPSEVEVAQEPVPAAVQQAAHLYMLGQYEKAIGVLEPLWIDLKGRQQLLASGLAAGWLALAHAQIVFENAEEPYKHALLMAERTGDSELTVLAGVAHGAFLLGQEDFDAARQALASAAEVESTSLPSALANILRAEALIGSAYGSGASETLENPQDLEAAKRAYDAAAEVAQRGVESDIVMGRVEEGLAAIAKFQRDKDAACKHATASVAHFKAAGASDFLLDGPHRVIQEFRCA